MDSPFVIAILVFVAIYLVWYFIRVLADFFLVGIALGSAILAYNIENWYSIFKMVLKETNFLDIFGMTLPVNQPDTGAIFIIAIFIVLGAVLVSIPFLPFSATYRMILGIEGPVFKRKEAKVRAWIVEEIQSYHQYPGELPSKSSFVKDGDGVLNQTGFFKKMEPAITNFWTAIKNKIHSTL